MGESPTIAFANQLDRVRLRAELAIASRMGDPGVVEKLRESLAEVERALENAGEPRDRRLARMLGLSPLELDLLWTAVATTVDPTLSPQLRAISGTESRRGISLATQALIAGLEAPDARALALALSTLHPLVRYGLLVVDGDLVPTSRLYSVALRVAAYLAGSDEIDELVARYGGILRPIEQPHFDPAQVDCIRKIARALAAPDPVLVIIEGPIDVGKRTAAAIAAAETGSAVVQIDASRLPPGTDELAAAYVALRRECLLSNTLPLVAQVDDLVAVESESRSRLRALGRLLDETPIPTIVTSSQPGLDLGIQRRILRVTMPVPEASTRAVHWRSVLGDPARSEVDVELLAQRYRLGAGGIRRARVAAETIAGGDSLTTHHLIEGVRNGIAERLGGLATRVEVKQTWDDLVLGAETTDEVRALVARVRHGHQVHEEWGFGAKLPRGLGTAGLFSGPPGTGKTMVAGLIARELDLELYQVDLSKVVSKWVGETEKQLARIFDAADAGHALLLFDEADALFAKRTEVKAAVDRYANLEVNYLLQRIETFGGISILTTNLDASIDPALRRRLAAHIVFDPPEHEERTILWERLLAPQAPRGGSLSFAALADEFPDMTGANIRNSVISAAFLAASEGSPITQGHLLRAGKGEYRAMGRVLR